MRLKEKIKSMAIAGRILHDRELLWRNASRDARVNTARAIKRVERLKRVVAKATGDEAIRFRNELIQAEALLAYERRKPLPKVPPPKHHPRLMALHDLRVREIRPQMRACLLAYGFLRGRDYSQIEQKVVSVSPRRGWRLTALERSKSKEDRLGDYEPFDYLECPVDRLPNFSLVWEVVKEYYGGDVRVATQKYAEWCDNARAHLASQGWPKECL